MVALIDCPGAGRSQRCADATAFLGAPQAAASSGQAAPEALLRQLVSLAPQDSVLSFIAMRFAAHSCARDRCVPHTVRQQVLQELRATPLHQVCFLRGGHSR
jgi:hypothetical protein